jgi:phosphopantothenoylcysteine decarboxylase/phosphopantothenate--cysteine ligase
MIKGKKILLGISGSIAAYKSAVLLRLLIKAGAEVKVVMTPASTQFIGPLTLSTLSKNEVLFELSENNSWANHVMLGRWADIMIIAPLSCNTLSKMVNGTCDNLLMAVYLSATCPVAVAPAMDEDMWLHDSTLNNIKKLESFGNKILPVEKGELASGINGLGRMSEPETILLWLNNYFQKASQFAGKKILVTAGPTYEAIDPVRFIGNHSTGKMGFAIAKDFYERGADVTIISGPTNQSSPPQIKRLNVVSAKEMYEACLKVYNDMDVIVLSAAVADYTVLHPAKDKIKKNESQLTITLEKTIDILKSLGEMKKDNQVLIGFALETNHEKENAIQKLQLKKADMIILNSLNDAGAGFGYDTNKISIFDKQGNEFLFDLKSKQEVASDIVNAIYKYSNG